jgi:Flp pilus assembly protein TadD
MIFALAIAASVAASSPAPPTIADTAHAIAVGRLEQARIMISALVANGAKGPVMEHLIADLDFASGRWAEARAGYQQLLIAHPMDAYLCEHAGIATFQLGDIAAASTLIDRATARPDASWRAWNARGAIADLNSDWPRADDAFAHAEALAPNQPEVLNNRGWSQLMRGNWSEAEQLFAQALAAHPTSPRVANNLELARTALASELPQRRQGESDEDWAARLNDAGVASEILGDKKKAVAAFTQALEASGSWYERAANNLQATERGQ